MAADIKELKEWISGRPAWMQEAANRIFKTGSLTETDLDELTSLCLSGTTTANSGDDAEPTSAPATVEKADSTADEEYSLRLSQIKDINGVNALAPKKPLEFGPNNLTVIYGGNGTGKSSYVRLLKHACGAREPGELHGNVFSDDEIDPYCLFKIQSCGTDSDFSWAHSTGQADELSGVVIYDTACGDIYLTKENEVAYEPHILHIFTELIRACGKISANLKDKRTKLPSKLPVLPESYKDTDLGKWYRTLKLTTKRNEIDDNCCFAEDDEKKLQGLTQRLLEKSPAAKALELTNKKKQLDALIVKLEHFNSKLSDTSCTKIITARKDVATKKETAKVAAKKIFADAPLESIGSETWKGLWEQARKYSTEKAYPQEIFPFTGDEARCVLCQQPLLEDSKQRLTDFENYIKGELQKEALKAEESYQELIDGVDNVFSDEELTEKCIAAGMDDEQMVKTVKEIFASFQARKNELTNVDTAENLPLFSENPKEQLTLQSKKYETKIKEYSEDAKKEDLGDLKDQKVQLETRKWLTDNKASIVEEIGRSQNIEKIKKAEATTGTGPISTQKGAFAEKLITKAFIDRFNTELKILGAGKISVELVKTRASKGRILHQVQLKKCKKAGINTSQILSEGEHRIVSLAAFIADVEGKQQNTPFIFDDPISSLDQDYEVAVVKRLVQLAATRQVIVFTHRLSLLALIQHYGKSIKPYIICLQHQPWGAGEPGDTPLQTQKPKAALNSLIQEYIPPAKKIYNNEGVTAYETQAKGICSEFRILLERTIEHELLGDVIQRDRRTVYTGKINRLLKIEDSDCQMFDEMMTKYSSYEHAQTHETPVTLPDPEELLADVIRVRDWRNEFAGRQSE